ncbi:transposase [Pseudomonas sp. H11T01]|uniref:transposase n=1 Tax=Pseudomonas sp. H11T01 TaxID=3402749 RepID=UPI003ACE200D
MKRFIQGEHRGQGTLLPESLDDYVSDTNPVRVVDVFVDELDLVNLGFEGAIPADTGRPAYHPAILLKIYIYGHLNRIQSSRRLEREAVLEEMQLRLSKTPEMMRVRKRTVEHPFGTLKQWMGATHFLTRKLAGASAEMSLNVLAYNLKRVIKIIGTNGLSCPNLLA